MTTTDTSISATATDSDADGIDAPGVVTLSGDFPALGRHRLVYETLPARFPMGDS